MDKKNRIHYVDAAKAIAIILVIIGHCYWISVIPRIFLNQTFDNAHKDYE